MLISKICSKAFYIFLLALRKTTAVTLMENQKVPGVIRQTQRYVGNIVTYLCVQSIFSNVCGATMSLQYSRSVEL